MESVTSNFRGALIFIIEWPHHPRFAHNREADVIIVSTIGWSSDVANRMSRFVTPITRPLSSTNWKSSKIICSSAPLRRLIWAQV
jgi:hypothetical protein